AGPRPSLEAYLAEAPEPARGALLAELVALDVLYRRKAGEAPRAEEYRARFPELGTDLSQILAPVQDAGTSAGDTQDVAPEPTQVVPPERQFGDCELLEQIAEGGMGVVWKARHVHLNRVVALKMIRAGELASPAEVQRFRQEAEAAASLDH